MTVDRRKLFALGAAGALGSLVPSGSLAARSQRRTSIDAADLPAYIIFSESILGLSI